MLLPRVNLVASSDTGDQNGISPRPPPPPNSGHSHSSSAISAAVGAIFALLIAAAIWRCIVFFRRYRRNTARRLANSGSVSKPLHEVRLVHASPCSYRGTRWEELRVSAHPQNYLRACCERVFLLPSHWAQDLWRHHPQEVVSGWVNPCPHACLIPSIFHIYPQNRKRGHVATGATQRRMAPQKGEEGQMRRLAEDHSKSQLSLLCLFRVLREL